MSCCRKCSCERLPRQGHRSRGTPLSVRPFLRKGELAQGPQEFARLLEIGRAEALGEPTIDRRKQVVRFPAFALRFPKVGQRRGGAEFPQSGLLAARGVDGFAKATLRG